MPKMLELTQRLKRLKQVLKTTRKAWHCAFLFLIMVSDGFGFY